MEMVKKLVLVSFVMGFVVSCGTLPVDTEVQSAEEEVAVISSLVMSTTSGDVMVKLVEAFDHEHFYRGYTRERRFVIRVKNIAYNKTVFVRHKMANGVWTNLKASYKAPAGNGWETWELFLNSTSDLIVTNLADEFVLGYTVSGSTYWDNNAGQNYRLAKNAGPLLGRGVMVSAVYLYNAGNGAVDVRNVGYTKEVTIVYTTNNWKTVHTVQASYAGPRVYYGYSAFDNPNIYGVERWYFFVPSFYGQTLQYAVKYTVNGQTYWDNNEGANYTVR